MIVKICIKIQICVCHLNRRYLVIPVLSHVYFFTFFVFIPGFVFLLALLERGFTCRYNSMAQVLSWELHYLLTVWNFKFSVLFLPPSCFNSAIVFYENNLYYIFAFCSIFVFFSLLVFSIMPFFFFFSSRLQMVLLVKCYVTSNLLSDCLVMI